MKRKIYRDDIIKAGLDLMFLNGYNGTGIKDITDRIEIPKGSFYNHFSSKEAFGLEVVKTYCDNGLKMYKARFLDSDLPPLMRFQDFFDTLIVGYDTDLNCKLGCVMSNFSAEMADVNEKFRILLDEEFNRLQGVFEICLKEAQDNKDLSKKRDAHALSGYILNGWHGALIRMKATGTVEPLENFRDLTMELLTI